MTRNRPLVMIAAVARNGVIGRDGRMPWHLPSDLAHFREATLGRPLLMGRRTYQSIGRSLPGRATVVVATDPDFAPDDTIVAHSLREGLRQAEAEAERLGADRIMVAGGGAVFAALIDAADAMLITAVDAEPEGDTRFPPIDPAIWDCTDRRGPIQMAADSAPYRIEHWQRRMAGLRVGAGS